MISPLHPETAQRIVEMASDRVVEILTGVADMVEGQDSLTLDGEVLRDPGERIQFYLDLDRRGVLGNLQTLAGGKWYRMLRRQFERDAQAMLTGGE